MLIVAMPKSASTSLVATLSDAHGLPIASAQVRLSRLAPLPVSPGFQQLSRFHRREVVELDAGAVRDVSAPDALCKFHVAPTRNNLAKLARVPKLVLLREPEEVVCAYRRGDLSGAFPLKNAAFALCWTERDWMERAEETGLLAELRAFAAGWRAAGGDQLVLEYARVVGAPGDTLARAERYLGLDATGERTLLRRKYSRDGAARLSTARLAATRALLLARGAVLGLDGRRFAALRGEPRPMPLVRED
jgi:hypothetical protein